MKSCRCYLYCDLNRCQAYRKLPRLPLEIWLIILKIKRWTDRCIIIKQLHQKPEKGIVFEKARKLFSEEEEEFFDGATGWIETYYFRSTFKTYNYCTLTYPRNFRPRSLFELRILRREGDSRNYYKAEQSLDYYFHHFLNNQVSTNVWFSVEHPFPVVFYFNKVG